jgi:hypothetical protein
MKINRLMQVILVSGALGVAVPALAGSLPGAQAPSPLCGEGADKKDAEKKKELDNEKKAGDDDTQDKNDKGAKDGKEA